MRFRFTPRSMTLDDLAIPWILDDLHLL